MDPQNLYSRQNIILSTVENEKIMQVDYSGRAVKEIGVTIQQYQEALKVIQGYKDQLIKAGILKKEKTVQELQEEQNEMLRQVLARLEKLEKERENEPKLDTSTGEGVSEPSATKTA